MGYDFWSRYTLLRSCTFAFGDAQFLREILRRPSGLARAWPLARTGRPKPANHRPRMKSADMEAHTALNGESTGGISNTVSTCSRVSRLSSCSIQA